MEVASAAHVDRSRTLSLDCPTRWNFTYKMLERALVYRVHLSRRSDRDYPKILSEEEWCRIEKICALLKPFDELTTLMSGKKYPTSNLYLKTVWKIELLLLRYTSCEEPILKDMAMKMKEKFDKYWETYSVVFSFAAILDPRYKFQFVDLCFQELDKVLNTTTAASKGDLVMKEFCRLFDEYANRNATQTSGGSIPDNQNHDEDEMAAFANYGDFSEEKTEIESYLDESRLSHTTDLDILMWWKENSSKYPILSLFWQEIS